MKFGRFLKRSAIAMIGLAGIIGTTVLATPTLHHQAKDKLRGLKKIYESHDLDLTTIPAVAQEYLPSNRENQQTRRGTYEQLHAQNHIRVLATNVHDVIYFDKVRKGIQDVIATYDPHFLCLSEVPSFDNTRFWSGISDGLHGIYASDTHTFTKEGRKIHKESGIALLSKGPLEGEAFDLPKVALNYSGYVEIQRGAIVAQSDNIAILCTHLDLFTSPQGHEIQTRAALEALEAIPSPYKIFTGDLNAFPWDDPVLPLLRAAGYENPSRFPRINFADHVLGKGFRDVRGITLAHYGSDHPRIIGIFER